MSARYARSAVASASHPRERLDQAYQLRLDLDPHDDRLRGVELLGDRLQAGVRSSWFQAEVGRELGVVRALHERRERGEHLGVVGQPQVVVGAEVQ